MQSLKNARLKDEFNKTILFFLLSKRNAYAVYVVRLGCEYGNSVFGVRQFFFFRSNISSFEMVV